MRSVYKKQSLLWSWRCALVLTLAPFLTSCQKEEVRTYTVPKEKLATARPHPHWTLPSGWTEQPAGGMRVGSFVVPGKDGQQAEVSVIPLAGAAGSELDNVNRWRGQVGQQPVIAEKLASLAERQQIGAAEGSLFDISGSSPETKKPARLLGAILAQGGTTWFFKMMGPDALVADQKTTFQQFLKSVSFGAADAQAPVAAAAPASLPNSHPPVGSSSKLPTWEAPASWEQQPPSSMLLARFAIKDPSSGKAEATVSAFPGDVGGLLANVNRWRNQLGLTPIGASELNAVTTPLDLNGTKGTLVEMTNQKPSGGGGANRIVVALLLHDGQTWFFKLLGDDAVVSQQKPALIKFVQSVRFPNA